MPRNRFDQLKKLAEAYQPEMPRFLRDMLRLPSESGKPKAVVQRIREEMEKVGFDRIEVDPMGNLLGSMGSGESVIAQGRLIVENRRVVSVDEDAVLAEAREMGRRLWGKL